MNFDPGRDIAHLKEHMVSQTMIHKGIVVNVRRDEAKSPDGSPCIREVVEHPGGVVVMPLLQTEHGTEFLMVEQWRYPLGKTLLEFPAGKLDRLPDGTKEDPFVAIQRELLEETGYKAHHWEPLNYLYTAPGFCDEKLHLYKATELEQVYEHHSGDEDEFLDVHRIAPDRAMELARQGHITDAKTLALLFYYATMSHRLVSG